MTRAKRRDFLRLLLLSALPGCDSAPVLSSPPKLPAPRSATSNPIENLDNSKLKSSNASQTPKPSPELELPLYKSFPALKQKLPHIRLATLPTPVEKLESLGSRKSLNHLYIKRDDLCGDSYGGSKIRKLEWLLGDAVHSKSTGVITFGAAGSNHAVATALYAKQLNLQCLLMLLPQPPSEDIRHKLMASHSLGAQIQIRPTLKAAQKAAARMAKENNSGPSFYVIESGGSSPLGNIGLVNAAFELKEQIEAGLLREPDFIYMALGTMGSAVGLLIGLMAAGLKSALIPVRASSLDTSGENQFLSMFDVTVNELRRADPSFPELKIVREQTRIEGRYLGGGYGIKTKKGEEACSLFHEETGLSLEHTYTGKTFAALLDHAGALRDKSILFWNTFGSRTIPIEIPPPESLPKEIQPFFKAFSRGE